MHLARIWCQENIIADEEDDVPAGMRHSAIPCHTLLAFWDCKAGEREGPPQAREHLRCFGIISINDDDHFQLLPYGLFCDMLQALPQDLCPFSGGDDDAEKGEDGFTVQPDPLRFF